MASDKKAALAYSYYEMISSYFKKCVVKNPILEKNFLIHFRETKVDLQYSFEEFATYSIENILPKVLGDYNLEEYDCIITFNKSDYKISVKTKDFKFDVYADYVNSSPILRYDNILKRDKTE